MVLHTMVKSTWQIKEVYKPGLRFYLSLSTSLSSWTMNLHPIWLFKFFKENACKLIYPNQLMFTTTKQHSPKPQSGQQTTKCRHHPSYNYWKINCKMLGMLRWNWTMVSMRQIFVKVVVDDDSEHEWTWKKNNMNIFSKRQIIL